MRRGPTLPGLGLSLGIALTGLGLLVVLPICGLLWHGRALGAHDLWVAISEPRVSSALLFSLQVALTAAAINAVFGLAVAWSLERYEFFGRRFLDGLVDLPFALPTAVAGIALTAVYAENGVLGRPLAALGIKIAFTRLGVLLALVFIGLPFVVRTLQPVIQDLDPDVEEAAHLLGASPWQVFRKVILPELLPGLLTGFALALARGIGEYGSVVFISGNLPMKTEIAPLVIVTKLEQYDYTGAIAVALVLLIMSAGLLLAVNLVERWRRRRWEPE
jgi:sulfate/thiosulfate transport system permease protein